MRALVLVMILLATAPAFAADKIVTAFDGSGAKNTRPFTVASGWEAQWEFTGSLFIMTVYDAKGRIKDIAGNQTKPGPGSSYQPVPGTYYLGINAIGEWKIRIVEVK